MDHLQKDVRDTALKVESVTKSYRADKTVFEDVTETFHPGEATLLSGPNGSGKTTFLRLLSVNTTPTQGVITYGELNIHRSPYRYLKHVGLVHDEETLPLHLSAVELLEWVLRSRNQWDSASEEKIGQILDILELDEARYDETGTYSTGMRKKTQIAAALISNPSVLILDEPLRGLDRSSTEKAMELFHQAMESRTILLMASHTRSREQFFDKVLEFPLSERLSS